MKYFISFIILLVASITCVNASSIVAIVNDSPITRYELDNRKRMLVVLNNIQEVTPDIDKQLKAAAMQSLVDEQLLYQHIRKTGGTISEAEIDESINVIEQRNKMPKGHLALYLKERGVNINSFRAKIKGELIKSNILSHMSRSVTISPKEIDAAIISTNSKDVKISAMVFTSKGLTHADFNKMQELQKKLKSCAAVKSSIYSKFAEVKNIETKISLLPGSMQTVAKDLGKNQASSVFKGAEGFQVMLMCDRQIHGITNEESNYVVNFLANKKIAAKAEKFIEDLRKRAYIRVY